MSIDDIRNLPVRELADKNCILFMWVTFPTLREAFSVIDAWGFTYKTVAFAWVKENKKTSSLFWGMGYWTRANVELCLLATKGSPKRHSANVHQVVFAPIAEHSKKPDIMNEAYCRDISIKTRTSLDVKRRNGDFVGAFPVYGYMKSEDNKNLLVPDPYASRVVRDIFRMRLEGASASKIASELNRLGILSPLAYKKNNGLPYAKNGYADKADCKWSATTIIRILQDETYSVAGVVRPASYSDAGSEVVCRLS